MASCQHADRHNIIRFMIIIMMIVSAAHPPWTINHGWPMGHRSRSHTPHCIRSLTTGIAAKCSQPALLPACCTLHCRCCCFPNCAHHNVQDQAQQQVRFGVQQISHQLGHRSRSRSALHMPGRAAPGPQSQHTSRDVEVTAFGTAAAGRAQCTAAIMLTRHKGALPSCEQSLDQQKQPSWRGASAEAARTAVRAAENCHGKKGIPGLSESVAVRC